MRFFIYSSAQSITPGVEIISTREESNLGSANSANTGTGTGIPVLYQLYSTGTVLYSSYSAVFNIGKYTTVTVEARKRCPYTVL